MVVALIGCGSRDDAASQAVDEFTAAIEARRGEQACHLLAPATRAELEQSAGKPCRAAILEETRKNVGRTEIFHVYGDQAQVGFENDTAFLSQFDGVWKVVAVACRPHEERPYDCNVKGP